jgi:hypothetical protein
MVILGEEYESIGVKKIGKEYNDMKFLFPAMAYKFTYLSANADKKSFNRGYYGTSALVKLKRRVI